MKPDFMNTSCNNVKIPPEMEEKIKQAMNDDPSYAKDSVQYLYGSGIDNRGSIMSEARLLTEREVFSNSNRNKLIWLEVREPLNGFYVFQVTPRSFNHWSEVMIFDNASCDNHILHLSAFEFKKTWRCWSGEPTDDQRKAEAWEEETLQRGDCVEQIFMNLYNEMVKELKLNE